MRLQGRKGKVEVGLFISVIIFFNKNYPRSTIIFFGIINIGNKPFWSVVYTGSALIVITFALHKCGDSASRPVYVASREVRHLTDRKDANKRAKRQSPKTGDVAGLARVQEYRQFARSLATTATTATKSLRLCILNFFHHRHGLFRQPSNLVEATGGDQIPFRHPTSTATDHIRQAQVIF